MICFSQQHRTIVCCPDTRFHHRLTDDAYRIAADIHASPDNRSFRLFSAVRPLTTSTSYRRPFCAAGDRTPIHDSNNNDDDTHDDGGDRTMSHQSFVASRTDGARRRPPAPAARALSEGRVRNNGGLDRKRKSITWNGRSTSRG